MLPVVGLRQSLMRIINLRKYVGRIYYIPAPGYEGTGTLFAGELEEATLLNVGEADSDRSWRKNGYSGPLHTNSAQWRDMEGPFINVWLNNVPFVGETVNAAPHAKVPSHYLIISSFVKETFITFDCRRIFYLLAWEERVQLFF